jgi:hypothetical protein
MRHDRNAIHGRCGPRCTDRQSGFGPDLDLLEERRHGAQELSPAALGLWARNHFPSQGRIVPSFYLECLIYNFADTAFPRDPVERFVYIASVIAGLSYASQKIMTVAGDKDILVELEWPKANFERFQTELRTSLADARAAIRALISTEAARRWRQAFNE